MLQLRLRRVHRVRCNDVCEWRLLGWGQLLQANNAFYPLVTIAAAALALVIKQLEGSRCTRIKFCG